MQTAFKYLQCLFMYFFGNRNMSQCNILQRTEIHLRPTALFSVVHGRAATPCLSSPCRSYSYLCGDDTTPSVLPLAGLFFEPLTDVSIVSGFKTSGWKCNVNHLRSRSLLNLYLRNESGLFYVLWLASLFLPCSKKGVGNERRRKGKMNKTTD